MSVLPVEAAATRPAAAAELLAGAIDPALATLAAWGVPVATPARRLLLAITGQESNWTARRQAGTGPAYGAWQFERAGVVGVLTQPASATLARQQCQARGVRPVASKFWAALEYDDALAAGLALVDFILRHGPALKTQITGTSPAVFPIPAG